MGAETAEPVVGGAGKRAGPGAAAVLLAASLVAGPLPAPTAAAAATAPDRAAGALRQAADTLAADTVPADTAASDAHPADTVPRDTLPRGAVPGDTLPADTAADGREPYFPDALPVPDSGYAATVWRCDRECLLDHGVNNLLDLLEAEWPGLVPLRGTYFGGPHHISDGLVGPALTEVTVEELPLPELAGGQLDLTRIPLAWLSEVLILRRAGHLQIRLEPVRHRSPQAYSRVTAGTGQPDLNLIRGLFVNGVGNHLAVSTGVDLLNTEGRRSGSDRLDFWGMASWTPGDGEGGAEILWRTQNMTRASPAPGGGGGQDFRRRDAYVRGRGEVASGVRVHLAAGRSEWVDSRVREPAGGGADAGARGPRVEAEGATFAIQAERPWGFGRASFDTWTGPAHPALQARLSAGVIPAPELRLDGSVRAGRWREFSTRSYRAGVRWSPDLGIDLSLHGSGARGTRGVPRPWLGTADSLRFAEYRGGASLSLGPYRLSGLGAVQDFGRQLPFSATFDRGVRPLGEVELLMGQGTVEGPILPVGLLLGPDVNPIQLELTFRRSRTRGRSPALYVPRDLLVSQLNFRDQFFQGDLGVTLRLGTRYRSGMTSVSVSDGEVTAVPSRTAVEWGAVIRIVGARIWYRSGNANRILAGNLAGQEFPPFRYSFGIKWEFTN